MKRCARCGDTQPLEAFYRQAKSKDGRGSYCKPCAKIALDGWRQDHPEMAARYQRRYIADPAARKANAKRSRDRHPMQERARRAVRAMIDQGELLPARLERCFDCGEPAAQYDHAYGYALDSAFVVEPVCHRCHGHRSRARGEHRRTPKAGGRVLDGRTWDEMPEVTPQ